MFGPDSTDKQLTRHALLMWRNFIQTGNVVLSTADAINSGQQDKCRQLDSDQIKFVLRLEELAAKQS